ncbi:hypothetical protein VTK73DRAFT_278 [Phialemonium thermophilum]|uniref:Uncharacterized protein n=1 Tax=Phialemonium thermophilum TaxID=223376 RepID=A0ABR3VW27_9PEZI
MEPGSVIRVGHENHLCFTLRNGASNDRPSRCQLPLTLGSPNRVRSSGQVGQGSSQPWSSLPRTGERNPGESRTMAPDFPTGLLGAPLIGSPAAEKVETRGQRTNRRKGTIK